MLRPEGMLVLSTHHPTGAWLTHGGSSFDVSLIEEAWKRGWDVRHWRLPLSELVAEFAAAGFQIDRLVEPRPEPRMAELFPDEYEMLSREPGFIAFSLTKRRP